MPTPFIYWKPSWTRSAPPGPVIGRRVVGKTTGRDKDSTRDQPNRSLKLVLVLPLQRAFPRTAEPIGAGDEAGPGDHRHPHRGVGNIGGWSTPSNAERRRPPHLESSGGDPGQMARMLAYKAATLRQVRQMLLKPATTEKARAVLDRAGVRPQANGNEKAGEPPNGKEEAQRAWTQAGECVCGSVER